MVSTITSWSIPEANRPRSTDLFILLITFGIFFMMLLGSHALLIPDEGRYSEIAREMLARGDYITPRLNGIIFLDKPILFYWLEALSIKFFGLQEWSLRLWPALFGIVGCLMMYVAGCLLFNRRTGILAALILSTTILYFLSAHYVNMDLEVAVLITGALLSFIIVSQYTIQYNEPYYKKGLLIAYLFAGLAVLTKGLIGIVIPALVIVLWGMCLKRWNLLLKIYLPIGLLLVLIIAAPWYILAQRATPDFFHYFFVTQHFSRFLTHHFNGRQPFWFYVPVILMGAFPWTIFLVQMLIKKIKSVWKNTNFHQAELFLLIWVLVVFVFFSLPSSKIMGYILPVFPPIALLMGNYFDSVWNNLSDYSKDSVMLRTGTFIFVMSASFFALILFGLVYYAAHDPVVSGHFMQVNLPRLKMASHYFYTIAGLLVFMVIGAVWQWRSKTLLGLIINFIVGTACLLFIFIVTVPKIHLLSTKPLAIKLATYLKPFDTVISYHQYYQDLPLYLRRSITVVDNWHAENIAETDNWRREFWEGSHFQKSNECLIDDKDFEEYFMPRQPRFYIFTDSLSFRQLQKKNHKLYELDRYDNVLLLSNKKN